MSKEVPIFVSFERKDNRFRASIAVSDFLASQSNPDAVLQNASELYERSICAMLRTVKEIESLRRSRNVIPARKVWTLGNLIFQLVSKLDKQGLQIDGLYSHLGRDLKVNRKWLEQVVTWRRYLPRQRYIPKNLNWGKCGKATCRVAKDLLSKAKRD